MPEKNQRWKKPLRYSNIDSIPHDAIGIYGFWHKDNGRCIYIGKAEKQPIRERIRQEYDNSHNPSLKTWIKYFRNSLEICYLAVPCSKRHTVNKLETRLIRLWNPETNKKKRR